MKNDDQSIHPGRSANAGLPAPLRGFDNQIARVSWRAWGTLSLFGAIIAVTIFWSVAGNIPTRVRGSCIIMHRQGVADVSADMPGRVASLLVKPGQMIAVGQEVAILATPELFERTQAARARLIDLEAAARISSEEAGRSASLSADSLAEQRAAFTKQAASDQKRIAILEQQIETNERMRRDGLITARAAAATLLDLEDARSALADSRRRLVEIDKRAADFKRDIGSQAMRLNLQVNDARRELAALVSQSQAVSHLRSQVAGRVSEIKAAQGSLVRRDTPIVGIERLDDPNAELEAVMYVSATDGKKISSKDRVELVPSHTRREEYGVLRARVLSTSAYPATPQGLLNTISNPDLMRELAHGAAPYEIRIGLQHDPAPTPGARNPYLWSAAAGQSLTMSSGALCEGEILVRHERPISLVLPIFRSTVSGT